MTVPSTYCVRRRRATCLRQLSSCSRSHARKQKRVLFFWTQCLLLFAILWCIILHFTVYVYHICSNTLSCKHDQHRHKHEPKCVGTSLSSPVIPKKRMEVCGACWAPLRNQAEPGRQMHFGADFINWLLSDLASRRLSGKIDRKCQNLRRGHE